MSRTAVIARVRASESSCRFCGREQTAAYIQHEAAELGVALRSEVVCRRDDGGNFVPDSVRLYGIWGDAERNALSKIITETLDIPAQRQFFIREGTQ